MEHHFDIENAKIYGIEEAIFIDNFKFWISKNKAINKHYHDGRTWTYNSVKSFAILFPYMSEKSIRNTLNNLIKQSVIMTGNYNHRFGDRTLWYAFVDENSFLPSLNYPLGQEEIPERANIVPSKGAPLPYTSSDTNTNTNTDASKLASLVTSSKIKKGIIYANTIQEAEEEYKKEHKNFAIMLPIRGGGYFAVSREWIGADFLSAIKRLNLRVEIEAMQRWLLGNPEKRKTARGMRTFVTGWLNRAEIEKINKGEPEYKEPVKSLPLNFQPESEEWKFVTEPNEYDADRILSDPILRREVGDQYIEQNEEV